MASGSQRLSGRVARLQVAGIGRTGRATGGPPIRLRVQLARKLEERGLPTSIFGLDVPVLELELEETSEDSRQPETAGQDG